MSTTDDELRRLTRLIEQYAHAGRWDAVPRLVQRGLDEHRTSADPELRRLCLFAAQWYLRQATDLGSLRSALADARDGLGSDLDTSLELSIGMSYLLLGHQNVYGYTQVAAWLRSPTIVRPDLALLVLEQAERWDPTNAVVAVVQAAAHLDLGNLTDAQSCRDRAEALSALPVSLEALDLRIRHLTGEEVDDAEWESIEFGPGGHRQQGYATVEHLTSVGRHEDALALALRMDAERSTIRTRRNLRQIQQYLGGDMPDVG